MTALPDDFEWPAPPAPKPKPEPPPQPTAAGEGTTPSTRTQQPAGAGSAPPGSNARPLCDRCGNPLNDDGKCHACGDVPVPPDLARILAGDDDGKPEQGLDESKTVYAPGLSARRIIDYGP